MDEQDQKPLGDIGDGPAHRSQGNGSGQNESLIEQGVQGQQGALLTVPLQTIGHSGEDIYTSGTVMAVEGNACQGLKDQKREEPEGEGEQFTHIGR